MNEKRRPPPEITPEAFFTTWLPEEIARLGAARVPDLCVRVAITGEGGGSWDIEVKGGALTTSAADSARSPLVTLTLSVQDWRAIMVGEPGPVSLTPPNASPTDLLFVDGSSQQLLQAMTGTFAFEVRNYNGRTWRLLASFKGPATDPPDAVIGTDAETYAALLARTISAPEAYFSQKITITGDAGRGMQVGIALLPKL
jgi:putative sterol carrier protein